MTLFTVLNDTSELLARVWSPFCDNWSYCQVCAGGVRLGMIAIIRLRARASLMNKGRPRSGAFDLLVSAPRISFRGQSGGYNAQRWVDTR